MSSLPLPAGYRAAGLHCGVKADPAIFDLSLFASDVPAAVAGVFTTNNVCGAPVKVSRERVPCATARAVVLNSGNSNACTGERGIEDARWMTRVIAGQLGCPEEDVLVCSTGVIGRFLPKDVLAEGMPRVVAALEASDDAFENAARGMMTTDTVPKQSTRTVTLNGKTVRVSGAAKGAAMIAPNMATMLCVLMADAEVSPVVLDGMLRAAVNDSFNCISVEGHTSTSDTVLLFANGAAGAGPLDHSGQALLLKAISEVAMELSTAIIRDAEGASHFVTIDVQGARSREEAFRIAKAIADSPLVKTAIHGADPNWGRIVSAAGYSGVPLQEEDVNLWINRLHVYRDGAPTDFSPKEASALIRNSRDTDILLTLNHGDGQVRYWTSDLTAEYVRLNADYTT